MDQPKKEGKTYEILAKKAGIGKNKVSPIGEKLDAHGLLAKMAGVGKGLKENIPPNLERSSSGETAEIHPAPIIIINRFVDWRSGARWTGDNE